MKLVYKNIIINTIVSVLILFVGEYSLYFFLKSKMEKETIEHLTIEAHIVKHHLNNGVPLEAFQHNIGDILVIIPIPEVQFNIPVIKNVTVEEKGEEYEEEHKNEKHEESFTSKQVVFDIAQDSKNYRISIIKTIDEDEGLAGSMSAIIGISGLIMLAILVLINVLVYHKLFSPVSNLIKEIKLFSVQQSKKIVPQKTTTKEFSELGEEISKMSVKMISDYTSVKEFTENMTHEIQTPLAVISSKLERCFQDKNLTEEQANLLSDAAKSVNKLFIINKGLTLLCKLDNKQYNAPVQIKINELIHQRIKHFQDFYENKNINISENHVGTTTILMDASLAEVLIDNLIKNAIQHNFQNGRISISTENNQLNISNTGEIPKVSTSVYFDRFYSQKPSHSLGLGLSIIKKIVDYYSYSISYNYENELHKIVIDFNEKS